MQGYNCIMVYNSDMSKLLFCKRTKDPYKGLYNLVGGKIDKNEDGFATAYRELKEETGIDQSKIKLNHMMDFTYYNQNCYIEVYVGILNEEVVFHEEKHPLEWLSLEEDFFDCDRFAGEGNIGHMVEQVDVYGMGKKQNQQVQQFHKPKKYVNHQESTKNYQESSNNHQEIIRKKIDLLENLDKFHTTKLGAERIKKNLGLDIQDDDIVGWCKSKIVNATNITLKGKNWYIHCVGFTLTVNAYSFTIITAHKDK